VRRHAVFLADYDLRVAEHLVQGVDLWINTPQPPLEACGTSGMKVLVNGGLNLSFLDGWWDEAYGPDVGWAPEGDGRDLPGDANRLYGLLENEVIPAFYGRDEKGLPRGWIAKMRSSMAELTPTYSANRALREYCERYYLPAAQAFGRRAANGVEGAAAIVARRSILETHWARLRFGEVRVQTEEGQHHFRAALYIDELPPDLIAVELFADGRDAEGPTRISMRRGAPLIGARGFTFEAEVSDARPADHYTPRAVPSWPDALGPLEAPFVVWAS
jgi:starch phosphorylase